MRAIIVGPDRGLQAALEEFGVKTVRIEGIATGERLAAAGISDAELLLLTDVREATAVPVAIDQNPSVRVIVYSPDSLPEFVSGQVDLALEPRLFAPDVIAEEFGELAS